MIQDQIWKRLIKSRHLIALPIRGIDLASKSSNVIPVDPSPRPQEVKEQDIRNIVGKASPIKQKKCMN